MESRQNYKNYRQNLASAKEDYHGAIVPYLGVSLRDLFFLEEGNPSFVPNTDTATATATTSSASSSSSITPVSTQEVPSSSSGSLINYCKVELMGSVYEEIWQLQQQETSVKPNAELQLFFSDLKTLSDDQLYELSKSSQPSTHSSNNSSSSSSSSSTSTSVTEGGV
jgi:hypothetical protein